MEMTDYATAGLLIGAVCAAICSVFDHAPHGIGQMLATACLFGGVGGTLAFRKVYGDRAAVGWRF